MLKLIKQHLLWSVLLATVSLLIISLLLVNVSHNQVQYLKPKRGPIIEAIYGLGKVKPDKFYEVKLAIIKQVNKIHVREGSHVKKAEALIEMAGGLTFYAPFDGTVTAINFSESQQVFPQQTILRMEDILHKYIEVSLEQQGALRVTPGQTVNVIFESIRGEILTGKVRSVFPQNDEFLAHITVDGLNTNVLPGMTADVAIEVGRKENALLVPLSAINSGRLHVRRNGKKKIISVKIGNVDGNWAEVIDGDLHDHDDIIVKQKG